MAQELCCFALSVPNALYNIHLDSSFHKELCLLPLTTNSYYGLSFCGYFTSSILLDNICLYAHLIGVPPPQLLWCLVLTTVPLVESYVTIQ